MVRTLSTMCLCALASAGFCTIDYTLKLTPGQRAVRVTIEAPYKGSDVSFQIPNWAPGSYRLVDQFRSVVDVKATADGKDVEVQMVDQNTWKVVSGKCKTVKFTYGMNQRADIGDRIHLPGPSLYMYAVGRINEDCRLTLDLPAGWKSACGLGQSNGKWVAPDYDVFADNPLSLGNLVIDTYTVEGIPHEIVYHSGSVENVDRAKVTDTCKKITVAQFHFWRDRPFKKYVWHFGVTPGQDGGGGLEHLSSTSISMAQGFGQGTVSVLSHEYFHAWNVKRLRSKPLGPFDYLTLPQTGALWFLEGVTDYYADVVLWRYGIFGEDDYMFGNIVGNTQRTRANAQRLEVSPYDSSYRVREAANGRGNSQGFGVNYYNTGWVLGLCLDAELRSVTGGRASLDDVIRELYQECLNKPGFEEGRIRELLVKHGGATMGDAYDAWVMKPGELPVEAQVAKLGLTMGETDEEYFDPGFAVNVRQGGLTVRNASPTSGLQDGDLLTMVGTVDLEKATGFEGSRAAQAVMQGDKPFVVKYKRGETLGETTVTPKKATRKAFRVRKDPKASISTTALFKGWKAVD